MKLHVLGVENVAGIGKESNLPFDIPRCYCQVPIEVGKFGTVTITGYGVKAAEMVIDPKAIPLFQGVKFPCDLELLTEQRFFRGKLETVVIGHKDQNPKLVANG